MAASEQIPEGARRAKPGRALRRYWLAWVVVLVVAVAFGFRVWSQVRPLLSSKYADVSFTIPAAPRMAAGTGETVYRVDATKSQATYGVDERVAGATADHVTGVTNGIAGDIAFNAANPAASRVGEIVINVEELHSDNNLRDARLRAAYLNSHAYPLARFDTTGLAGLPASFTPGRSYRFTMSGNLSLRAVIAPVTWTVQGAVADGQLTATATTTIKQSQFHIGPISIAGFLRTADDVTLTLKLVAVDPSRYTVPGQIAAPASVRHARAGPSFAKSVGPVLAAHCASCHNPGQVGAAHWQLATAADAAKDADGIRVVTQAKFMPPWPASPVGLPLVHPATLDAKSLGVLEQWAAAGGPLDVPGSTAVKPLPGAGGPSPRQDVLLRMPEAYLGSLSNPNDYRCFVLDPQITQPTFLTGYKFLADRVEEIHHAQVFHLTAAQGAQEKAREGSDGLPGWQCYSGPGGSAPALPGQRIGFTGEAGLIAGWAPGQDPVVYPAHSGVLLQAGDVLVFQIHYHYGLPPTPDRSGLALQLDPGTADLRPIVIVNPLAPVEIPCSVGVTAPLCDRNAALMDDFRLYGPAGFAEQGLLGLCGKTVEDLAAGFDGIAHSSCDTHVPVSGTVVAMMGHMHTLGQSVRLTLDPQTAAPKVLLDIPTWNFDWQMNYGLVTPLHVDAGQTVRLDCSWDRSLDPNRPPKYIVFAEGTEDEMCFATYALIPDRT